MDRESKILTSWYGAKKTLGTGTAVAADTTSSDSSQVITKPLVMISRGRVATALSNVLRNGMPRSETKTHSKPLNESAKQTETTNEI